VATIKAPYLEQRRRRWYAVLEVPADVRHIIGKPRFVQSTKTDNLSIACVRRDSFLHEWRGQIAAARRTSSDPLVADALALRNAPVGDYTVFGHDPDDPSSYGPADLKADEISSTAERIEATHGLDRAKMFYALASGTDEALQHLFDQWQAEKLAQPKELANRATVMRNFSAWLTTEGIVPTVNAITRRVAGRYVSAELLPKARATAAKYLSTLSRLWHWLKSKGVAEENPWLDHELPRTQRPLDEKKRAFFDDEVSKLLGGPADRTMRDMMMVAALSGMRLEEIAGLRVRDVLPDRFVVVRSKTVAGQRAVPIHSALVDIVTRRKRGLMPDDRLFPDVQSASKLGTHGAAFSKAFTKYRRACGVGVVPNGSRASIIDFHSWRRWFITKAEQAGIVETTIQAVVGHKRGSVTLDNYSFGPGFELAKKCVEAVKLPRHAIPRGPKASRRRAT
jgi:integrase